MTEEYNNTWESLKIDNMEMAKEYIFYIWSRMDALRAELADRLEQLKLVEAELDRMKDANRWFSVEERLPEDFQPNGETKDDYEVMTAGGFVVSPCYYSELNFWCFCYNSEYVGVDKVTHWRPMPAPPEASDE